MPAVRPRTPHSLAELKSRPQTRVGADLAGLQHLQIRRKREALLYVPEGALAIDAPLAVMLHGAGGSAENGIALLRSFADELRIVLLAPESRKATWDIISDAQYGPDVDFIDECLDNVFSRYAIDPQRVALGGFSDGASYALSLGLSNGSLFRYILAFSPGFMAPVRIQGKPRIFMSHGTRDEVLPIDRCSRKLLGALRSHNLTVDYREFDGPHTVPEAISREAVELLVGVAGRE